MPFFPRGFQETAVCRAHRALTPAHSSPILWRLTARFPHHAAPTSVIVCATTLTLMQRPLHRAHSTYACKITVSSLTLFSHSDSRMSQSWFSGCPARPQMTCFENITELLMYRCRVECFYHFKQSLKSLFLFSGLAALSILSQTRALCPSPRSTDTFTRWGRGSGALRSGLNRRSTTRWGRKS